MPEAKTESKPPHGPDAEFLLCAPEIYIFCACLEIVNRVWEVERALDAGEIDRAQFHSQVGPLFSKLCGLAEATHRFDIIVPFTPGIAFSPFFWRWFNWWYDYRQGLTPEQLEHSHRLLRESNPAVLDHRPTGHWLRYREAPPFGFRMSSVPTPPARPAGIADKSSDR